MDMARQLKRTSDEGMHEKTSGGQTELFPMQDVVPPQPARNGDLLPQELGRGAQGAKDHGQSDHAPVISANRSEATGSAGRIEALKTLLDLSSPVRPGGKAAAWFKAQRIFKKTWESQGLRVVDHYERATTGLRDRYSPADLRTWGLFNKDGHLRFYKHALLVPWYDGEQPVYLQALAPDDKAIPPELTVTGPIPCPYNARLLDGKSGRLYLCARSLDALELLEAGFPAVALTTQTSPKNAANEHEKIGLPSSWLSRFRNKSVYLAFDGDAAGEASAAHVMQAMSGLQEENVEVHHLKPPAGKRICDWLRTGGLGSSF